MTVSLLDTHQVDNYQVTCKQQMGTNPHRKAENAEQETLEVWIEPWERPLKSAKGASHATDFLSSSLELECVRTRSSI